MAGTAIPSDDKPEYTDAAGRPSDSAPGPRGQRMAQLGILTRAQKKKPVLPKIRTSADGVPDPNDVANNQLSATLAEKAHDRLMQIQANGQANNLSEQDPMKKSLIARSPMMRR
jgi:hypothetical protein